MIDLVCKGQVGDAFMFNCILHDPRRKETLTVQQYVGGPPDWEPAIQAAIQQIYSLSPNVAVEFIDEAEWRRLLGPIPSPEPPGFRPSPLHSAKKGLRPSTAYPAFVFPGTQHDICPGYIACCPKSGHPGQSSRDITEKELTSIVEQFPEYQFVIVGTSPEYAKYRRPNVLNLTNQTSLLEALGIVSRASRFIGIQGLMSFVALSQKVPSVVYTKTVGHTGAFVARLFPQWINDCTLYMKSRSEDIECFHRFMGA